MRTGFPAVARSVSGCRIAEARGQKTEERSIMTIRMDERQRAIDGEGEN
jgi:hypothetical protein